MLEYGHSLNMDNLPAPRSQNKNDTLFLTSHQLAVLPCHRFEFRTLFSFGAGILTGLIFWGSCAGSYNCCEFMFALAILFSENSSTALPLIFSSYIFFLPTRDIFSLAGNFPSRLGYLVYLSPLPCSGITNLHHQIWLFVFNWLLKWNSGSHCCQVSILSTEPYSSNQNLTFMFKCSIMEFPNKMPK